MLRALSPSVLSAGLRGSTLLGAVAALLMMTACDQEAPPPANPAAAPAGNSDLFSGMGSGDQQRQAPPPLPPPPSDDGGGMGSKGPGAAAAPPPLVPVLDPAVAAECKSLREKEKTMRAQADELREKRVAPATEAFENAYEAFNDCQQDFSCANNEGRYAALGTSAKKAEAAMEKEEESLMKVEGELHDISQSISVKCGDF